MAFLLMNLAATAQSTGVTVGGSVFGGGNLANVGGNTSVLIDQAGTVVTEDVYGGGALADVGTNNTNTTDVTILQGNVNGAVYGGGLGDNDHAPLVNGVVTVKIGNETRGNATIGGYIFGCNNANGTPKDNVNVHIWSTAHTSANTVPDLGDNEDIEHLLLLSHDEEYFALQAVYGGGNVADYVPAENGKTALVHIHNCDNTVKMVYGGGRAAAVGRPDNPETEEINEEIIAHTSITVEGGRIDTLFAGGDGHTKNSSGNYLPADIYGNVGATITGGYYTAVFGASNTSGTITGTKTVAINKTTCTEREELIGTLFGGANLADASGDAELTIACGAGKFGDVYGGCNLANITGNVTLTIKGGTFNNVYGGSKGRAASDPLGAKPANIDGNVTLNLNGGSMVNAFGGSNINGNITGSITVNVNDQGVENCGLGLTNVYGAGNLTAYTPTDASTVHPEVNVINGAISGNVFGGGLGSTAVVTANPKVTVSGGSIGGSVYGGGEQANTTGYTSVNVSNGSITGNVFGGGEQAAVSGNVEVNVSGGTITGDVYGGGALANVNTNGDNTTTVNILGGTLNDVYGGGLGDLASLGEGHSNVPALVHGKVYVNIGAEYEATEEGDNPTGATSINAVYGCNNVNGSPQDDVEVNVYQTAHPEGTNAIGDNGYVIDQVFGGGNQANYTPNGNHGIKTTIFGCYNTIRRVFGGSNAADATNSSGTVASTTIYGGRIDYVFGGGNGEVSAADLHGNVELAIHGGRVDHYFGGSNQSGTIYGSTSLTVDSDGPCETILPTQIEEFFCGGNFANIVGDVKTTITCDETMANVRIVTLYGGCNQANITGNVELTVEGGNYDYIYGGSKGTGDQGADIKDYPEGHELHGTGGNVTLNIHGGTIRDAVFGGCNINGTIGGTIVVNVEDKGGDCPLSMENADVFGGGNLAVYTAPTATPDYPEVNIINATVRNVFGGGNGDGTEDKGSVTGNPKVYINKDKDESGDSYPSTYRGVVMGNVYGGGNAAKVDGSPTIELCRRAKVFGNVYGGGNEGEVTGDTKVIVNGEVTP